MEMPQPDDVAAIQRLLGLAQYLSKFLPHLSDVTKPLRELTQKDTEWTWGNAQQEALDALKKAVSSAPVLRYYNLQEEVTLQCDASQSGLGAAMMQNGQPVAYASRALTSAETRYAQIEKELLAIVFACQHFESYIYGRDVVHIETDHQPLVSIVLKPLNSAPSRLQRMLLKLQKFNLKVTYKNGKSMYLADTLSRAYLPEIHTCAFAEEWTEIDHTLSLAIPEDRLQQIKQVSSDDPVMRALRKVILQGWPESKSDLPECTYPYFDFRDELTVQDQLIFKGAQLVVPAAMRKEMMALAHASHIGIEGCIRRARETMFWPRMSSELKEYVSKCDICLAHRSTQGKEPIVQHEFPARPWAKVGADLCNFQGRTLLVVCDYYSNFIEVESITKANTSAVCKVLKTLFARYGVPDSLVSDNGPQFASAEFVSFARKWGFEHVTSSPHYPQSNGKAENAVKTVKRLFTKSRESGQSEFLALMDWRNTPTEGVGTSPAQRFLGRRCKTLLPITGSLLQPDYPTEKDRQAINKQKQRQEYYYNQHVKRLKPIAAGEAVRMRLPGRKSWSQGVCTGLVGPRSYRVQVGESTFIRNRKQLIRSGEELAQSPPDADDLQQPWNNSSEKTTCMPTPPSNGAAPSTDHPEPPPSPKVEPPVEQTVDSPRLVLRRSTRNRKPPDWITNYVPT